jgi:hypothetical protein
MRETDGIKYEALFLRLGIPNNDKKLLEAIENYEENLRKGKLPTSYNAEIALAKKQLGGAIKQIEKKPISEAQKNIIEQIKTDLAQCHNSASLLAVVNDLLAVTEHLHQRQ